MAAKSRDGAGIPRDRPGDLVPDHDKGRRRIRELARAKGITLQELSKSVGMNNSYMQQHCSLEKRQPWVLPEDILQKVAAILAVDPDEIRTPYKPRRRPAEERRAHTAAELEAKRLEAKEPPAQHSLNLAVVGGNEECAALKLERGDLVVAKSRREGGREHVEIKRVDSAQLDEVIEKLVGGVVLKVLARVA